MFYPWPRSELMPCGQERRKERKGRREEGGREIGGGSKKNPLHLVRDGADLLIVGGFGGIT